jgi:hypothetical protein
MPYHKKKKNPPLKFKAIFTFVLSKTIRTPYARHVTISWTTHMLDDNQKNKKKAKMESRFMMHMYYSIYYPLIQHNYCFTLAKNLMALM